MMTLSTIPYAAWHCSIILSRFPADFLSFRGLYHISVSVAENPKANIDDLKYKVGEKKF